MGVEWADNVEFLEGSGELLLELLGGGLEGSQIGLLVGHWALSEKKVLLLGVAVFPASVSSSGQLTLLFKHKVELGDEGTENVSGPSWSSLRDRDGSNALGSHHNLDGSLQDLADGRRKLNITFLGGGR